MGLAEKVNEAVEIHNFAGSDTWIAGDRGVTIRLRMSIVSVPDIRKITRWLLLGELIATIVSFGAYIAYSVWRVAYRERRQYLADRIEHPIQHRTNFFQQVFYEFVFVCISQIYG